MAIIKNPLTLVKQESGGGQSGEYFARVVDYDGTVLKYQRLNNGNEFIMPTPPTHSGLVFDGWSSSQQIVDNKITINNNNFIAGPMYHTESGLNEFDIELDMITGLTTYLYMVVGETVNWGDGNSDTATSTCYITHTYASYGEYTIKASQTKLFNHMFYQHVHSEQSLILKHARISSNVYEINSALVYCYNLQDISIPVSVTKMTSTCLTGCSNLTGLILPNNLEFIADFATYCRALKYIVTPYQVAT